MTDYEVGDVVCYRGYGTDRRYVKVDSRITHKGCAGFEGQTIDTQMTVWGYDHQIVAISKSRGPLVMI